MTSPFPSRSPRTVAQGAKTIRILYSALLAGLLFFALVSQFLLRRTLAGQGPIPPLVVQLFLGLSLVLCAAALVLRGRIPKRATDQSPDLFWVRAATPALMTWATLEAATFIPLFLYGYTGSPSAIGLAALAIVLFAILNPGRVERA